MLTNYKSIVRASILLLQEFKIKIMIPFFSYIKQDNENINLK